MTIPMEETASGTETAEAANPALGLFAIAVLLAAVLLLMLLPFATAGQPAGKSWFLSPRNAPFAALVVMGLGAGLLVAQFIRSYSRAKDRTSYLSEALLGFEGSREALLYCALFGLYVAALGYVGFAISTLVFGQVCLWVSGLRTARWALKNLLFTVVLVLVLRVFMGLWFPQAPVLEFAPAFIANTVGPYL